MADRTETPGSEYDLQRCRAAIHLRDAIICHDGAGLNFLRFLFRKHPFPTVLLGAALAALAWFGFSLVREAMYFSDPAHREQDLAEWMSPRYVGKSWDLPPEVIIRIMELEPDHKQRTLEDVTQHLGITLDELQARVEAAKAEQRARHGGSDGGPDGGLGDGSREQRNGADRQEPPA